MLQLRSMGDAFHYWVCGFRWVDLLLKDGIENLPPPLESHPTRNLIPLRLDSNLRHFDGKCLYCEERIPLLIREQQAAQVSVIR